MALVLGAAPGAGQAAGATAPAPGKTAQAIFAGGCFWCVEADFEKLPGVITAESGYTGGKERNPSYEQVSAHATGHTEAVRLTYDPAKVSYAQLVEYFWRHIDPTVQDQQFCDHGPQYRSGIYPLDSSQKQIAEASKAALVKSGRFKNIYTEIAAAGPFWPAEDYHQDYYQKNPVRYQYYRFGCGRDARVKELWGEAH
ncbi:MAG: peptide-methionine (S)-S-oxide reductase [Nevskiaceae bacterium]|nr:MAG: peptide-methionine (S)-S-oxide reductase [Nevskiaceae bacterium]TAM21080.1 MAG: peptide-methionine (S)-S-oxide reductase [Nevskiaceae bacterium]